MFRIPGPDQHVDVGVVLLVMEGGAPAEVPGRDLHRRRQLRLVSQQQPAPTLAGIVSQPGSILPSQRVDEGPHRSVVTANLFHHLRQVGGAICGKQPMGTGTLCHILQVAASCCGFDPLHAIPGGDVFHILFAAAARLDVAGLLNQALHSLAPF